MAKIIYKTKLLLDNKKVNLAEIYPEKQAYLKHNMNYKFNLPQVANLLKEQTQDFTREDDTAKKLDEYIWDVAVKYYKEKNQDLSVIVGAGVKEPKAEPTPAEPKVEKFTEEQESYAQAVEACIEAILDKDYDTDEEKDSYIEAVEAVLEALSDEDAISILKGLKPNVRKYLIENFKEYNLEEKIK